MLGAANNFVWIIRDETPKESGGLMLLEKSRVKPHTGTIKFVGDLIASKSIKNGVGKKAIWHNTTGQEVTYKDETYFVLPSELIIGVD